MARSPSAGRWIVYVLSVAAAVAHAQESTSIVSTSSATTAAVTSQAEATSQTSPTATSDSSATTTDVPLSLWAIADSLLSSYYPSTTITQVDSLTWPATVIIDSSTYAVHPTSSAASAKTTDADSSSSSSPTVTPTFDKAQPSSTTAATSKDGPGNGGHSDRTLGIALGVVFGLVTLGLMVLLIWYLCRRQRRHGGSRSLTPTDSEIGSWRSPHLPAFTNTPMVENGPREWGKSYNRVRTEPAPPMAMHPAFIHRHTASTAGSSDENPFYTPAERSEAILPEVYDPHAYEPHPHELEGEGSHSSYQRTLNTSQHSSEWQQESRPSTPFNPLLMMQGQSSAPPGTTHGRDGLQNPFSSPEDDESEEAEDLVSPIIPSRSPQRRHSPLVHYPSWSEVSEFDFNGSSEGARSARDRSSEGGGRGDGYRRESQRESVVGRSEMA